MGSMIHLAVGSLEIDWGKNYNYSDHSPLYQIHDVTNVPYFYLDDANFSGDEDNWEIIVEQKEGLSKPLHEIIERIELLGHTFEYCKKEFLYLSEFYGFEVAKFNFEQLHKALSTVDVTCVSPDYGQGGEDFGKFFRREIFPRLELSELVDDPIYVQFQASEGMESLTPYTILSLLSGNPSAQNLPVNWAFKDLEENGWAKKEDFVKPLDQENRFLIVTEGTSDSKIIKHAFDILKPHVSDFFDYIDMDKGYPFSGTGNLVNFVKGLVSIGIQNNVIVLFDNDAEGVASFNRCNNLSIPENMRILKLPELAAFNNFETFGPDGNTQSNVNGLAISIECYLDLKDDAQIRWNSYNKLIKGYQGELIAKDRYKKEFLNQRSHVENYDYSKIETVLNMIIKNCVSIKENTLNRALDNQK